MSKSSALRWGLVIAMGPLFGCASLDDRCGSAMHYDEAAYLCVCDDDAIAVGGGCEPCAEDEIVSGGACACPAGETKNGDDVCVETPGLGQTCDADMPCTDAVYNLCGAQGCTHACAANEQCPDAYTCDVWEANPSCRTFSGVGAPCTEMADCAGLDAAACMQGTCVMAGCAVELDDCPRGSTCCDLSAFGLGTVCTPPEVCP